MPLLRAHDPSTPAAIYAIGAFHACLWLDYLRLPVRNLDYVVRANDYAVVAPSALLRIHFGWHVQFTPFSNCLSVAGEVKIGIVVAVSLFVGSVA